MPLSVVTLALLHRTISATLIEDLAPVRQGLQVV
jgi:hypothetical protein